jgi:hypothetical protein
VTQSLKVSSPSSVSSFEYPPHPRYPPNPQHPLHRQCSSHILYPTPSSVPTTYTTVRVRIVTPISHHPHALSSFFLQYLTHPLQSVSVSSFPIYQEVNGHYMEGNGLLCTQAWNEYPSSRLHSCLPPRDRYFPPVFSPATDICIQNYSSIISGIC